MRRVHARRLRARSEEVPDANRHRPRGPRGHFADRVARSAVPGLLALTMRGQTVAVTGAGGFLGGRLVHRLLTVDCRIIRLGRSPLPAVDAAPAARVTDVIGDVSDRAPWDALVDADIIFHFAAQTSGAAAASNPEADFRVNVTPLRH